MAVNNTFLSYAGLEKYDAKNKAWVNALAATIRQEVSDQAYDDSGVKADIKANSDAIDVLNGTGDGSVAKQVADAVASIVNEAPEAYNTLKEISDWISTHADSAATMNSNINTNTADIEALEALVGELPAGAASTTLVAYIAEAVGASKTELTGAIATAKQEAIDAAAADATSKANKALDDAKAYADGLADNYATAAQGALADTALQPADITTGSANGTIAVDGQNVAVFGLGSAAYTASTAYERAGAVEALQNGAVATNAANIQTNATAITGLDDRVAELEGVNWTEISDAQIDALFPTA